MVPGAKVLLLYQKFQHEFLITCFSHNASIKHLRLIFAEPGLVRLRAGIWEGQMILEHGDFSS